MHVYRNPFIIRRLHVLHRKHMTYSRGNFSLGNQFPVKRKSPTAIASGFFIFYFYSSWFGEILGQGLWNLAPPQATPGLIGATCP